MDKSGKDGWFVVYARRVYGVVEGRMGLKEGRVTASLTDLDSTFSCPRKSKSSHDLIEQIRTQGIDA